MFEGLRNLLGKSPGKTVEAAQSRYETAQSNLIELQKRASQNDAAINQAITAASGANPDRNNRSNIDTAAVALIKNPGMVVDARGGVHADQTQERLMALERERVVIRRALVLARAERDKAADALARAAADEAMPVYRKKVGRIAAALQELGDALADETAFRDEFAGAGLMCPLPVGALPGGNGRIGKIDDLNTPAGVWFRDVKAAGLLS